MFQEIIVSSGSSTDYIVFGYNFGINVLITKHPFNRLQPFGRQYLCQAHLFPNFENLQT